MKKSKLKQGFTKKGYKFRLYPDDSQKHFINQCCNASAVVYNLALHSDKEKRKKAREEGVKYRYNCFDAADEIRVLKKTPDENGEYPFGWLAELDQGLINYATQDLENAWNKYFSNIKIYKFDPKHPNRFKPKFKDVKTCSKSYATQKVNNNIKVINNEYLKLPKMEPIRMIMHRSLPEGAVITKVTVSVTKTGEYYASLSLTVPEQILPNKGEMVGVDVGIKEYYCDSKGNKVYNPKFLAKADKTLRRRQRMLSRQEKTHIIGYTHKKGDRSDMVDKMDKKHMYPVYDKDLRECRNYQKTKKKVNKIHEKVKRQRAYFQDVESLKIAQENQLVCMEDLKIQNMQKNHKLAGSISDAAWYQFKSKVDYKVKEHGGVLVSIPTFYPSSQTCSECGYRNSLVKNLKVRKWECPQCGAHHDRDINAGKNILAKGLEMLEGE